MFMKGKASSKVKGREGGKERGGVEREGDIGSGDRERKREGRREKERKREAETEKRVRKGGMGEARSMMYFK